MKYKKYEYDNYCIHFLKTDKFKSIMLSMFLINDFNRDSLTKNALLRRLLTISSKKLKDETEVAKKVYDLYNSGICITNDMYNNVLTTDFNIEIINDKYSEEGLTKNALEYFFDTIFLPNISGNKFDEKSFKLAKKSLSDYYDRQKEDKNSYAIKRAHELFDEENLNCNLNGYKEDLNKIKNEDMVSYYNELLDNANVNIFVIGDFIDEEMLNIINSNIKGKFNKNENKYVENIFNEIDLLKEKVETEKNNQSKLVMIYKIANMTMRERNVVLPVFNRIFGIGNNSRLFKNVREEKSLAYDIRSIASRDESLISVLAGISKESMNEVINLVKEELINIESISDEELEIAKQSRKTILKKSLDDNESLLYIKISNVLFKNEDLIDRLNNIETVTKEEIINLSKKMYLNVIYMLEGDNDNEKD